MTQALEIQIKTFLASTALVAGGVFGTPAQAGTSSDSMTVRATVLPECTFMTPNVNFQSFTSKRVQITIENDQACAAITALDQPVITATAGPPNTDPGCELKSLPTDKAAKIYEACYSLENETDLDPGTILWTVTF